MIFTDLTQYATDGTAIERKIQRAAHALLTGTALSKRPFKDTIEIHLDESSSSLDNIYTCYFNPMSKNVSTVPVTSVLVGPIEQEALECP